MNESWKFLTEIHNFRDLPKDDIPEIVFWGRSNVGKSSLINSITKSKLARTSKTPGRTRSLIFFEIKKKIRFVDFPGYGFSFIPKKNESKLDNLIDQYVRKRKNIIMLLLLIDSLHGIKDIDKFIFNRLNLYLEHKILLIFTKKDRLKNNAQKELLEKYNEFVDRKLNKKFFNTSIKEANTIILLKKFLMHSL